MPENAMNTYAEYVRSLEAVTYDETLNEYRQHCLTFLIAMLHEKQVVLSDADMQNIDTILKKLMTSTIVATGGALQPWKRAAQ